MTIYNYFSRIDVTPPPALDGSATWAPLLQIGIGVSSLPTDLASRRSFPRAVPVIYVNGISIAAPSPVLGGAIAMLGGVRHIIAVTYSLDNTSTDSLGITIYDYSLHLYRLDEQIALGTKTGTWQSIDTIQVIYSSNISSFGGPDWIEKHLQAIFSADGMNGIVLTESSDTASGFTISPLTGFTTATNIPIIITHEDTIAPNRIISDSELRSLAPHYFSDDIFDFRVYGLIDGKSGSQWKSYEASGSPEISNIGAGFNFNFGQPCANGLHGETVIYTKLAQGNEYTIMLRARVTFDGIKHMIIDIIGISRHRGLEVLTTLYEFTDSQPMLLGHVLTSSASDGIPYKDYAIIDDSRWLFSAVIPNYDYRNRDMTRLQYFAVNLISPGNIADLIVDVQPIVTNRPSTIFTHCGVLRDKFIKPKKSP